MVGKPKAAAEVWLPRGKVLTRPIIPNFGDDLNDCLFEQVFGVKFEFSTDWKKADYVAIGSALNNYLDASRGDKFRKRVSVLGMGFIKEPTPPLHFWRDFDFKIVRGELTRSILRENGFDVAATKLGDLALLSSYWIKPPKKQHKLGVIAHLDDMASPIMWELYQRHRGEAIYINVKDRPEVVLPQIAACEMVASTSLHGLIVADCYHVPNIWLENRYKRVSKPVFKYHDYYSAFGLTAEPIQAIDFLEQHSIDEIPSLNRVTPEAVESLKADLHPYLTEFFKSEGLA